MAGWQTHDRARRRVYVRAAEKFRGRLAPLRLVHALDARTGHGLIYNSLRMEAARRAALLLDARCNHAQASHSLDTCRPTATDADKQRANYERAIPSRFVSRERSVCIRGESRFSKSAGRSPLSRPRHLARDSR